MTHYEEFKNRLEDRGNEQYRLFVRPYERIKGLHLKMLEEDGYYVWFMWSHGNEDGLEILFTRNVRTFLEEVD